MIPIRFATQVLNLCDSVCDKNTEIKKGQPADATDAANDWEEWEDDHEERRGQLPQHLPSSSTLCWRCGLPGHRQESCRNKPIKFCSKCGLIGTFFREHKIIYRRPNVVPIGDNAVREQKADTTLPTAFVNSSADTNIHIYIYI